MRIWHWSHSLALRWLDTTFLSFVLSLSISLTALLRRYKELMVAPIYLVCWTVVSPNGSLVSFLLAGCTRLTLLGNWLTFPPCGVMRPITQSCYDTNQTAAATTPSLHPASSCGVSLGSSPLHLPARCSLGQVVRQLCITSGWAWYEPPLSYVQWAGQWTPRMASCTDCMLSTDGLVWTGVRRSVYTGQCQGQSSTGCLCLGTGSFWASLGKSANRHTGLQSTRWLGTKNMRTADGGLTLCLQFSLSVAISTPARQSFVIIVRDLLRRWKMGRLDKLWVRYWSRELDTVH